MADRTLILCIVIGLSWADFYASWQPATALARGMVVRSTIGSALLLSSWALILMTPDMGTTVIVALASAAIGLWARSGIGPNIALFGAAASFAFYLTGVHR